jgi:surface polysaccharide O-acyltransferase-like enzyme
LVVLSHVSACYYERQKSNFSINEWLPAAAIASAVRSCVPLFFMLTGYLLIRADIAVLPFWRRRISRLAIPWLFWSGVYIWHRKENLHDQISCLSMVRLFTTDGVYYHLWFLYPLLGVYLAIPFASALRQSKDTRLFHYAVALWFCSTAVLPTIGQSLTASTGFDCTIAFEFPAFTGFLGVAMAGPVIGELEQKRTNVALAGLVLAFGVGTTFGLTVWHAVVAGETTQKYFGYLRPEVLLASGALFYLLRVLLSKEQRAFKQLAGLSFGVYLVHPLVMELLAIRLMQRFPTGLVGIPIVFIFVSIASFLFVKLFSMVPILRHTVR